MPESKTLIRHTWIPDLPDKRDVYFEKSSARPRLPGKIDLRRQCPPVYHQGSLGSCTSNALAGLHQFLQLRQGAEAFEPSRLFLYYNARVIEGTVRSDAGTQLRNGLKTIVRDGVCSEKAWPYVPERFARKPKPACYRQALRHQALRYFRIEQKLAHLRTCLAEGQVFVFGIATYKSMDAKTVWKSGKIPLPKRGEDRKGGHALMCVGYDDARKAFLIRNSWGETWGEAGYGYLPYDYALDGDLAADFWTVRTVET